MSPARRPLFALLTCLIVVGCDEDKLRCGAGTHEVDDACVPTLDTGPAVDSGDADDSDQDEDGFHTPTDCDDTNANVHPEAIEYCDGIDNDCDGQTDEDDAVNTTTFYIDADGDGYGDPDTTIAACAAPSGTVDDDTDCDDNAATTHPGAEEIWYDGIDNDCAEGSDDDADGDGYPGGSLDIDCDDTDPNIHPLAEEVCGDGIDNNCDADFGDCGFSGTVHLTDADASVLGHTADLSAGTSVRFAGDLDGDGTEDFLLGAPRYDGASGINAGGAFFVAGPLVGSEQLDTVGVAIVGATTADLAGTVVVPAGDIDGDGFDDILVGAAAHRRGHRRCRLGFGGRGRYGYCGHRRGRHRHSGHRYANTTNRGIPGHPR